jgi:starch phosphorylase
VREYTDQHYLPAATKYHERAANKGEKSKQIVDQINSLEQKWDSMYFGKVKFETKENQHKLEIQIYFNELDPKIIEVELLANGINGEAPFIQKMMQGAKLDGKDNGYIYKTTVNSTRPLTDFTARAIPYLQNVSVPLEFSRILWQR